MKKLTNYRLITTEDGSITFFSEKYQEACHSTTGAKAETQLHYINGCKIENKLEEFGSVNILEVGFGVGHGFFETLKVLKANQFINFYSFEIDEELIKHVLSENNISFTKTQYYYLAKSDNFELRVYFGDAREAIKYISPTEISFHAIYQDAFSPKRNAILWTTQWFKDLYILAHKDCIMSTYSSSSSIRKSMIAANWKVQKGEKFGPKRSSTRAVISGETDTDIKEHLQRSPAVEITDKNFENYTIKDTHEKN